MHFINDKINKTLSSFITVYHAQNYNTKVSYVSFIT